LIIHIYVNLFLGDIINIKNVSLSKASYVKLRAQSVEFLEISNPKAMFEVELRKFTCLTEGDTIYINYSDKPYYIDIVEVKPNKKACVVEADVQTDFDEPLGYQTSEYKRKEDEAKAAHLAKKNGLTGSSSVSASVSTTTTRVLQKARADDVEEEKSVFKPFAGSGFRIDGKQIAGDAGAGNDASNKVNARDARAAAAMARQAGGGSTSSAAPKAAESSESTVEYETRIGDKYSKVKSNVSAFNGPGHKLK
jgi:ubiquitin fusion degradation protein 1